MANEVFLTTAHWEQMRSHVSSTVPNEACGLVASKGQTSTTVYEITNEAKSPYRYRMTPEEQLNAFLEMEKNGWKLLAIYHSHPNGPAGPSQVDLEEANYPEVAQLIWSATKGSWNCEAFRFHESKTIEIPIRLTSSE